MATGQLQGAGTLSKMFVLAKQALKGFAFCFASSMDALQSAVNLFYFKSASGCTGRETEETEGCVSFHYSKP